MARHCDAQTRLVVALVAAVGCTQASASPTQGCGPAGPRAAHPSARAVTGAPLAPCISRHRTGFTRDGYCSTGPNDTGVHVVCARVTTAFLSFTATQGNDLTTPRANFPGLRDGDGWCLCASRWREALTAGVAPPVVLAATDAAALRYVSIEALRAHSTESSR